MIAGVGYKHITGVAASKAIMSLIHSASMESASREIGSIETWLSVVRSNSHESAALKVSAADARASAESLMNAPVVHNTAKDPFTFTFASTSHKKDTRAAPPATTAAPAPTSVPPPPGTPVSTLAPGQSPASAVPSGVPEYNWRMCQNDLVKMGQNKQSLVMDQPAGQAQSESLLTFVVLTRLTSNRHNSRWYPLNMYGLVELSSWQPNSWSTPCRHGCG